MKLTCYPTQAFRPEIRPGCPERDWMDEFADRHPYRCLPLSIANCTGWELIVPRPFRATWNGGPSRDDVTVESELDVHRNFVGSMFARGTLTFGAGHLFRTEPGWDLWVGGAPNWIKHGIQPLTGIVETSWLPQPFTMNWHFTTPGTVSFEAGEPFCMIMPVPHDAIDSCQPVIKDLKDEPELEAEMREWARSRREFNDRILAGDVEAQKQAFQRHYFKGQTRDGEAISGHIHKRRLPAPRPAGADD